MSIKVDCNLLRVISYILHYSAQRGWKCFIVMKQNKTSEKVQTSR